MDWRNKMKKIITSIGNQYLNQKLRQEKNIEVIGTDIQYQEGIFELLEKEIDIDFLIISETIEGERDVIQLIEKIKEINKTIKIILILENKKEEIENIILAKGIYKIIYHNQIDIQDFLKLINKHNESEENQELKQEINYLKELIRENSINQNNINKNSSNKNNISQNKNHAINQNNQNNSNNTYYQNRNNSQKILTSFPKKGLTSKSTEKIKQFPILNY